jgi:uncharacterized paraquat-inducible protein A
MTLIQTDIKHCNECKGTYNIKLLEVETNQIALCKDCRDKLYNILDNEDEIIIK